MNFKKRISFIILAAMLFFNISVVCAEFATNPQLLPVEIKFSLETAVPERNKEIELKLSITFLESINAEIACIMPRELKVIENLNEEMMEAIENSDLNHIKKIIFSNGSVTKGEVKEYIFHIITRKPAIYELIACVNQSDGLQIKSQQKIIINLRNN